MLKRNLKNRWRATKPPPGPIRRSGKKAPEYPCGHLPDCQRQEYVDETKSSFINSSEHTAESIQKRGQETSIAGSYLLSLYIY